VGRWIRVLLGPLPATVLLLPLLFAGGLGAVIALLAALVEPAQSAAARWASVTTPGAVLVWVAATGVGVLALWVAVLAEPPAALKRAPPRRWLAAGLLLGLLAAGRWFWTMAVSGSGDSRLTWVVWLALLAGPVVLAGYYFVLLVRR